MKRSVQPELLDALPPDDPRAQRSRRDLRRINVIMRNHTILARALRDASRGHPPRRITELGAGDGCFLLRVAEILAPAWPLVSVTLLDRLPTVPTSTRAGFTALGWQLEEIVGDVFSWSRKPNHPVDAVVANLFLHHFSEAQLVGLFNHLAHHGCVLAAVEPRRAAWPLFCSRLLWAIGCNAVTCHDAVASVRAGFVGLELSALWPDHDGWEVSESRAGLFSHRFVARRKQ